LQKNAPAEIRRCSERIRINAAITFLAMIDPAMDPQTLTTHPINRMIFWSA
jgi:hypothetical protein